MLLDILFLLIGFCAATPFSKYGHKHAQQRLAVRQTGPNYPAHTIDQPIDHFPTEAKYAPHTNATFKQRYYFDSSYYKPGGPVYLYIGGETSGPSRFENLQSGIIQILMQATNGLGVILENRYYGQSYPFSSSTTDQLRFLTNEQTIADNAYFAQHVQFPGIDANLTAPATPWILYGGSLAGAQTAFSLKVYGQDILYGGIASSAVITVKPGYPEWYAQIQKYAPQDCVARINGIIDKMDSLIQAKNTKAVDQLKAIFGLGALSDIRDFAQTIAFPLGGPFNYPTNSWQELNWSPLYGSDDFFEFCTNVTDPDLPANISAVDDQLAQYTNGQAWTGLGGWAYYIKEFVIPLCGGAPIDSTECFSTQNKTYWADTTNGAGRSFLYTSCIEAGLYQAAPAKGPSLISRVLQVDYTQQWCTWAFPKGQYSSIPAKPDLNLWNKYGSSNFSADRLAFIDGSIDPWLDACYHSTDNPDRYYSDLHPELLIPGAGHHWDSYGINNISAEPQFIRNAHLFEIRVVKRWLKDFANWKPKKSQ